MYLDFLRNTLVKRIEKTLIRRDHRDVLIHSTIPEDPMLEHERHITVSSRCLFCNASVNFNFLRADNLNFIDHLKIDTALED